MLLLWLLLLWLLLPLQSGRARGAMSVEADGTRSAWLSRRCRLQRSL